MWTSQTQAQRRELRRHVFEERQTVRRLQSNEIHDAALIGPLKQLHNLTHGGGPTGTAERYRFSKALVATGHVDDTERIALGGEPLYQAFGLRSFSAATWANEKNRLSMRPDPYIRSSIICS